MGAEYLAEAKLHLMHEMDKVSFSSVGAGAGARASLIRSRPAFRPYKAYCYLVRESALVGIYPKGGSIPEWHSERCGMSFSVCLSATVHELTRPVIWASISMSADCRYLALAL